MGIIEELKKLIPTDWITDIIDGANVEETAKMVDLDTAYKLLLVEEFVHQEDIESFSNIPPVIEAQKLTDGRYKINFQTAGGPDFRILTADEAKIMRARFLLLKGYYYSNFNRLTLPKQNEVAALYDIHWVPNSES